MDHESLADYIKKIRSRYQNSSKLEKSLVLDQYCKTFLVHRKSAVRRINAIVGLPNAAGRKKEYSRDEAKHLKNLWLKMGQIGSKKIKAALPHWLPHYRAEDINGH